MDQIKKHEANVRNLEDYLCLGRAEFKTGETGPGIWKCVNRNIKNLQANALHSVTINKLEYDIPRPGIYAVLFVPRMTPNLMKAAYCGMVCKHKKLMVAIAFIILPVILGILVAIWKYIMLYYTMKDKERESEFSRTKFKELETVTANFKGQSLKEKLAETMDFQQNPLQGKTVKDLGDINKLNNVIEVMELDLRELNDVKKKLLAKTKKQIKKIGVVRDDIENLGTNRFEEDIGIEYQPKGNYTLGLSYE